MLREEITVESGTTQPIIDSTRDDLITPYGLAMLKDAYLLPGETVQDRFMNVAKAYGNKDDNGAHIQRIYDYISKLWFMPATPVLSNAGTNRGQPISCFLNEANDSLDSIRNLWSENIELASRGGGIGSYWGNLRSIGESVGKNGKTSGIIPFIKVQDSLTLAISQGSLRRGSAACYLPVWHPEIEEFIEIRRDTGGDVNRRATNSHHGILVSDAFMEAVDSGSDWNLLSPHTGEVVRTIKARDLWIRILIARMEEGEPYIVYSDNVNRMRPEHHKKAGLFMKTSNLCSEITLPTGLDHHGKMRTAVCCLSSLNLETWEEWKDNEQFIKDIMMFLDNILTDFINNAPSYRRKVVEEFATPLIKEMEATLDSDTLSIFKDTLTQYIEKQFSGLMDQAIYSASRERSVGLGVMGFHSFLQMNNVPFDSVIAKVWNKRIFKHIKTLTDKFNYELAVERGACPDAAEFGVMKRFSHVTAVAPTASISIICGQSSPGIEPYMANAYQEKRKFGSFPVRNKHLTKLLEDLGKNTPEVWSSIMLDNGSVQNLDFLTNLEKDVYKTAFEIDPEWIVEHAADRTPYIDQSQSVNLYLPPDIHKRKLNRVHRLAWKKGVKSLYYCRSYALSRAQKVSLGAKGVETHTPEKEKYSECLSCQ